MLVGTTLSSTTLETGEAYRVRQATLSPGQAVDVLNDRMRQVGTLNAHIADWLKVNPRLPTTNCTSLTRHCRSADSWKSSTRPAFEGWPGALLQATTPSLGTSKRALRL